MGAAAEFPTSPPGVVQPVGAQVALVLAPHYDDEVLGCGGLLQQLVEHGTSVHVLFLSDGTGGIELAQASPEYGRARRREAQAVASKLGFESPVFLDLPDGHLIERQSEIRDAVEQAILDLEPDLLLLPSPHEVTADHQAVFDACSELFSTLRRQNPLLKIAKALRILAYEVNHPHHPNLLVDVTGRLEGIQQAMALYATQEARHNYSQAALGLRRFRALSLPADIEAAEGYVELRLEDFQTRSRSQLLAALGVVPRTHAALLEPTVTVVVRTKERPQLLAEALASLDDSTYERMEVIVVNDGDDDIRLPEDFSRPIRCLKTSENRGRAAAANLGISSATTDFVLFLDDDDLFAPEHVEVLVRASRAADVSVVYSDAAVTVHELDPETASWRCVERRLPYSRDFDADLLLLDNYIPFHTILLPRELLDKVGPLDESLPFFEDWELLIRLSRLVPFHHLPQATCEYRHFRGGGHILGGGGAERLGESFLAVKAIVLDKHRQHLRSPALAGSIAAMREEIVAANEGWRTASLDLRREREARLSQEAEYHRQRGELTALRADHAHRGEDLERLYKMERELRTVVDDQTHHLGRTYDEIERLNALISEMQQTRAWRWHQTIERWRRR